MLWLFEGLLKYELRPLSEQQLSKLEVNLPFLEACIDPDSGLIGALYAKKCITRQQKEYLSDCRRCERNSALLDIISRRSAAHFVSFIEALNELGQTHIARVLDEGGGRHNWLQKLAPPCSFNNSYVRLAQFE
jgi:hypothetical protein